MKIAAEAYLDHLTFQSFERPIFVEMFGPLVGLDDEWRAQGASPEELDLTAWDFDYVERAGIGCQTGQLGGQASGIEVETDEYLITTDSLGRRMKLIKGVASIALPLDYPVTDMDSWLALKPWFEFSEARFGADWEACCHQARAAGRLLCAGIPGGFDLPRQLLGEEGCCLAFYTQPELIADILETVGETCFRVLERVSRAVRIDVLSVHEDCAGKSGSLVGPRQIREYIAPYYRRSWDLLRERGTRLFQQDSDGNLNSVLESWISDAGINASLPMEPAAGMDVVDVRRRFGERLAFYGGLDKHALRRGREAIDAELEAKITPLRDEPGIVWGLDHRIPPGTPLEAYRYYVRRARELLGLPAVEPGRRYHWMRMAF